MKTMIALAILSLMNTGFARSVMPKDILYRAQELDLKGYQLALQTGEKVFVSIGYKVTQGCHPQYIYNVSKKGNRIEVTKARGIHAIMCVEPREVKEGIIVELDPSEVRYVELLAPKDDKVEIVKEAIALQEPLIVN